MNQQEKVVPHGGGGLLSENVTRMQNEGFKIILCVSLKDKKHPLGFQAVLDAQDR